MTERPPRGEGRQRLLIAAVDLIRRQGFAATSVDDLCRAAKVTKGAFFHHFASKEALGVAALHYWTQTTGVFFGAADYHRCKDPLDRVIAYIGLRRALLDFALPELSCLAGTMVQEAYLSSSPIRIAAHESILAGAAHVVDDLAETLVRHPVPGVTAESLALLMQTIVQGGIVIAKATNDPEPARAALDHLERYLRRLFESDA